MTRLLVEQAAVVPVEHGAVDAQAPVLRPTAAAALWMIASAIVTAWLGLAALHIDDDYRVTHTQGVWIAVTETARAGELYPPLFDGERYAGTRYLPGPILLNALAADLVGDTLRGGKLLAAILTVALFVLLVAVPRSFACPWPVAAALASVVVATEAGLQAGTTIGGDLLPVVLQVGALAVALRGRDLSWMMLAGVLAGLAAASKLTGAWGALAIVTWLVAQRQWLPAATFVAACAGTASVVLGTVQMLSGGGLSENLLTFSTAGVQGAQSLLRAPNQVLYNLREHAVGAVVLLPFAVIGAWLSGGWRQLSVIHFALGYAFLLLLAVYSDIGTGFNQLLDIVAVIALAVGHLAGRAVASDDRRMGEVVLLAVAVAVLWAAGIDLVRTVGFDLRRAVAAEREGERGTQAAAVVAGMVRPGEEVLAEDPSIHVMLGRRPIVMDPFMLTRLDRRDPRWVDPLIAWIANRRFDLVVLVVPLENRSLDFWWSDYHFGPRVAAALRASYRPDGRAGRYFLYRPSP